MSLQAEIREDFWFIKFSFFQNKEGNTCKQMIDIVEKNYFNKFYSYNSYENISEILTPYIFLGNSCFSSVKIWRHTWEFF